MGLRLNPALDDIAPAAPSNSPRKAAAPFGDYELLDEIARGGMGIVYRARQMSLDRIVAVKVLLFGKFSSDDFVQRFKAEAQAAAALQHPNIVAIHEVGQHEGQHYFSMEFVQGSNLAELIREHPLPALQAATYLKTVAEAIHYAHQQGVLHRDLKPSNVLIDSFDQPRITDFGLAKRTDVDSRDTTTGELLGSPSYMTPEQADRKRGKTTPATDVYALGAILYHLLTGRPPFIGQTLEETLLHVLHTEPVSPRLLVASVPKDLETICLKCLEKEPRRRYRSALELAEDIDRWKTGRIIAARPATPVERAWRWARRKPAIASLSAAVVVVLITGIIVSTWQAVRAKRAEQFLLGEAAGNDKVVEFLRLVLEGIPQSMAEGRDTTMMLDLVEKAAAQMDKGLPTSHRPDANLREIIGRIYHDLHHYPKAEAMFREALATEKQMHGPNHLHVARCLTFLGRSLEAQDKLDEAESLLTDALAITHRDVEDELFEFEDTQTILGGVRIKQGKFAAAESLFQQVLNARQRRLGDAHPSVLTSLNNLSAVLLSQGKLAEAEKIQRQVLAARRTLPDTDRDGLLVSLHNLAATLSTQGKYVESMDLLRQRLKLCDKFMGPEHPETISSLIAVSAMLLNQNNGHEAELILRDVLKIQTRTKREADPLTAKALTTLAWALEKQGKLEEAETAAVRALDIQKTLFNARHPEIAESLSRLAGIVKKQGRREAAEQMQRQALAIRTEVLGPKHLHTSASLLSLATSLRDQGRFTEADAMFRDTLSIRTNLLHAHHADIATTLHEFAASLDDQRKYTEAKPMLLKALDIRTKLFGVTNAETIESLNNLANMLGREGRFPEAEERFRQVLAARQQLFGPEHRLVGAALDRLGGVLWDQNKRDEAELTVRQALPIYRKLLEAGDSNAVVVINRYAWVFLAMRGKIPEAEKMLNELLSTIRQLYGDDSPAVAERLNNYAKWLDDRGNFDAAEAMFLNAMALRKKLLPAEHGDVADSCKSLARFYGERGRFDEAEPLFRQALLIEKKRLGPHDREGVIHLAYDLVLTLDRQRKHEAAEPLLLEINGIVQQSSGFDAKDKREALERLGAFYVGWAVTAPNTGKSQKAAEWRKKLSDFDLENGEGHP